MFDQGKPLKEREVLSANDRNGLLLQQRGAARVDALIGELVRFFERGGHLGNLYREDFEQAIARFVNRQSSYSFEARC